MEIKYRGTETIKQGGKLQEIDVYSNDLKLSETQMKIFAKSLADCVVEFYKDPKNVKAFEEWKKNNENVLKKETKK